MDRFLGDTGWTPNAKQIFAGALPYRKYGWFTRMLMKRIVKKGGGDTDTSRNYEYTDWNVVNEFASSIGGLFRDLMQDGDESPVSASLSSHSHTN